MENGIGNGNTGETQQQTPKWKPIGKVLRRVAGVLVEKAKTTPDIYPMTINAITTASNQKSNRSPQMQLEHDDVEEALDELREMGAVVEVHGDGRKPKFKHRLYEWLGVEKVEMAIMAELLLRGGQTLGDLRARASRMEKIDGQSELKPLVQELVKKGLIIELTPPGRGQMVTHGLFMPEELAKIERNLNQGVMSSSTVESEEATSNSGSVLGSSSEMHQRLDELNEEVETLKAQVAEIMKILND